MTPAATKTSLPTPLAPSTYLSPPIRAHLVLCCSDGRSLHAIVVKTLFGNVKPSLRPPSWCLQRTSSGISSLLGGGQMIHMSLSLDDFNTRVLKYEWRWQWCLRQQSSASTVITAAQQPCCYYVMTVGAARSRMRSIWPSSSAMATRSLRAAAVGRSRAAGSAPSAVWYFSM